jgi:hypothetical protein
MLFITNIGEFMRFIILLCLVIPFHSFAETSLWKISKSGSEMFIGGTIHVLSASDYPLPVEFEQAYQQADMIVFETDLAAMAQPEAQQQLLQRVMYNNGKTLKDDLKAETYQTLVNYVASTGLMIESLNVFKPPMVMITLLMAELNRLGMADSGVDSFFNNKATLDGKILGSLESLEVQLSVIENMGKGHENEMILSTIEEMKELPSIMYEMKQAWRTGNSTQLEKIGIDDMKNEYPELYQLLLVDRNNAWMPRIEAFLKTAETEFILVGALHLVGSNGIISSLISRGYTVELFKK